MGVSSSLYLFQTDAQREAPTQQIQSARYGAHEIRATLEAKDRRLVTSTGILPKLVFDIAENDAFASLSFRVSSSSLFSLCKISRTRFITLRGKSGRTTTPAPKKGWFSEDAPEGSTTIPIVALIGFAVGGIITFVKLSPGRGKLTAGEQQLLA